MERKKLTRIERAKQFAPFDALKGLHEAIKLKEYEHEQIERGILSEDKIKEISNILLNLNQDDVVNVTYYDNGHYLNEVGNLKLDIIKSKIIINQKEIFFDDLQDIKVINK